MSKMSQKAAVFAAITSVFNELSIPVEGNIEETITKEQRNMVNAILVEGFNNGEIDLSKSFDEKGLKKYVSGLTSNWLRKDVRLNGGTKHVAKNPGSRTGSSDPELKSLTALYNTLETAEEKAEVMEYITARKATLTVAKAPVIDFSKLPAELAAKFQKQ
jgi:hypothetical protein